MDRMLSTSSRISLGTAALCLALAAASCGPADTSQNENNEDNNVLVINSETGADLGMTSGADMGDPDDGDMGGGTNPATGYDRVDVGTIEITDGTSEMLTLELPDDVVSLTIVAVETQDQNFIGVGHLEGPDGTRLIEENPPDYTPGGFQQHVFPGPFHSPNRFASSASGVAGMLAPNNPGVDVAPGTWTYQLVAATPQRQPVSTTVEVSALVKRAEAPPTRGTLDVHLHFTGANGWTAATAPDDEDMQAALERMRQFYSDIGIELGEITYDDVDAPTTMDATGGPGSDMHEMFAKSTYDTGVSLFFIERLTSPFGGGVGGVAGGTPGPNTIPNTSRSGVVVATALNEDPKAIGHIMGHETGHFLGLYHTTELFGNTNDQIGDTAVGESGDDNLMYPTVTATEASLSEQQGWVLRRNAAVGPGPQN